MDAPERPPRAQREPEQIGAYRILERISEGGMGVVYRAEQRAPVRRVVALKVVKIGMDTKEVVARFEAERQALALMSHPNVAKVFDAGMTESGRPYFAMEYVPGVPLTDYCDDNRLPIRERLELFAQVCNAVQHAHQKGIIHRDLKPSNILVAQFEGKPVPKVIDFGIAKATNQALTLQTLFTHAGTMVGTPEYASPEQVFTSGLDVDTRTDIYSLGVILYQLLTGTLPLDPGTLRKVGADEMVRIIREEEPPRPSTRLSAIRRDPATATGTGTGTNGARGPGEPPDLAELARRQRTDPRSMWRQVRGDLDWITLKAMDKDRTRRYETANALANDVRRYLRDEPVTARPPTAVYQVKKFVRRHRFGAGATAAVVFALVGGIIGTTASLIRAWRAEALEKAEHGRVERLLGEVRNEQHRTLIAIQDSVKTNNALAEHMLLAGQFDEAQALTASTLATARGALAPDATLTWDAADLRARAALKRQDAALAWATLKPVIDSIRARKDEDLPPAGVGRYFTDLADVAERGGKPRAEVERLLADAVRLHAREPLLRGRAARRLGWMLEEDKDLSRAQEMYARAAQELAAAPDAPDAERREAQVRYRDFLVARRNFEVALPLLKNDLDATRKKDPEAGREVLGKQADVVDALWQLGAVGTRDRQNDAQQEFARLRAAAQIRRGGLDTLTQHYWRQLILRSGLDDVAVRWKSPTIRARLWLVMTDALVASPSPDFRLDELRWGQLHFELRRWDGRAGVMVREGGLETLRALGDPAPGIYLLAVRVPREGGEPLRVPAWLLFANWDAGLFPSPPDSPSDGPPPGRPAEEARGGAVPSSRATAPALLLGQLTAADNPYADLLVNPGLALPPFEFRVLATADLNLPQGTYRIVASSDDGVTVSVDGETRIDSWRRRPVSTDADRLDVPSGTHHVAVEYFQGGGNFLLNLYAEPMGDRAAELMREVLGDGAPALRQWHIQQAAAWELAPADPQRAAASYREASRVGCELGLIDRADQARVTRALGRALAHQPAPVANPAAEAAGEVLKVAHGGEGEANALLDLARAELAAGRSRDEVAGTLSKAFHLWRETHPGPPDRRGRDFVRYAQLLAIGAANQASDGSLTGQVLCAADEMLRNEPAPDLDPKDLSPSSVHYQFVRWDPAGNAADAADAGARDHSLADDPPAPDPESGLYVLRVQIDHAGPGGAALTQAHWILPVEWHLSMYKAPRETVFTRNTYTAMVGHGPEVSATTKGLALLDSFGPGPLPPAAVSGCAIKGQADVKLPAGLYRFELTASDGARLTIGPYARVINAWPLAQPPRTDSAEIQLDGGVQHLVLDYFHTGGAHKLWLRAEPLTDNARALATRLGRRPARPLEVALREQDEALAVDPQSIAAFTARAGIHVQMGQLKDAASDFAAPADIDFGEPLWPQQRALLALLDRDTSGYQRQREEMLRRAKGQGPWRRDRSLIARFLLTTRLAGPDDPADPRLADLKKQAQGRPPGTAWQQPMWDLATGVGAFRDGKWGDAITILKACRVHLPPAARATAELFLAMALQRSGDSGMAEEALQRGIDLVEALGGKDQPEWDTYLVQDWLTCKIALREATELIRPGPAAGNVAPPNPVPPPLTTRPNESR